MEEVRRWWGGGGVAGEEVVVWRGRRRGHTRRRYIFVRVVSVVLVYSLFSVHSNFSG